VVCKALLSSGAVPCIHSSMKLTACVCEDLRCTYYGTGSACRILAQLCVINKVICLFHWAFFLCAQLID
jgi:hypothetical protein